MASTPALNGLSRSGGAAAWLDRGGLLVPSARADGSNLAFLVGSLGLDDDLVIVGQEIVEDRTARPGR